MLPLLLLTPLRQNFAHGDVLEVFIGAVLSALDNVRARGCCG